MHLNVIINLAGEVFAGIETISPTVGWHLKIRHPPRSASPQNPIQQEVDNGRRIVLKYDH